MQKCKFSRNHEAGMIKAMWKPWSKKQKDTAPKLPWSAQASEALEASLAQAPVPAMLKGAMRKELTSAAETAAQKAGHSEVAPEDLLNGLMAKIPASMRGKVEDMMRQKGLPVDKLPPQQPEN
jgi:hypothetical protein